MSEKKNSGIESIIVVCINKTYCFDYKEIRNYDFDYTDEILRIDFTDCSFVEFYKRNIICVMVNYYGKNNI